MKKPVKVPDVESHFNLSCLHGLFLSMYGNSVAKQSVAQISGRNLFLFAVLRNLDREVLHQ